MGRTAYGVKGIELEKKDYVVGMVVVKRDTSILTVSENGFGKRSEISEYRVTNRGGKGVINMKTTDKTGNVIAVKEVVDKDGLMIITEKGIVIRQDIKSIRVIGRATQGVKLINLESGDRVTDVARIIAEDDENGNGNGDNGDQAELEM